MEFISTFIDFFIHLDVYLDAIIQNYGVWTYLLLFLIVFVETGLVVMPFLPGDSLLFAAGTFAARGVLSPLLLFVVLSVAAILGDTVNYWIGSFVGLRAFRKEEARFFKKEYLVHTQKFYEKHGGKAIIFARFIPIIRTFAPFVAGIGKMHYGKFLSYNVSSGFLWVSLFVFGGKYIGDFPVVKENFTLVILGIVILSVLPGFIEYARAKLKKSA